MKVATEIANAIGLKNVTFRHCRAEEEKRKFDFVVSRAVMPLGDLIKLSVKTSDKNSITPCPTADLSERRRVGSRNNAREAQNNAL